MLITVFDCRTNRSKPERRRQPPGASQQLLGLARHICLFEVGDALDTIFPFRLAHGCQDMRLGDMGQVIVDPWGPAFMRHVETDLAGQQICKSDALGCGTGSFTLILAGFNQGIDAERNAMREKIELVPDAQSGEKVPKVFGAFGETLLPAFVTLLNSRAPGGLAKRRGDMSQPHLVDTDPDTAAVHARSKDRQA